MTVSVNVNGLSLCHKGSGGFVRSTLPDICLTPGKGGYPVPYVNMAFSRDLAKGTVSVLADGGHSCAIKPSEFQVSFGDEPGKGGGIKSGVNQDRATCLSWSADVFFEGEPVCRLTDKMLLNRGNTVSVGGEQQPPLDMEDWLKELCEIACECKFAIYFQNCMARKIEEKYYTDGYPNADSPFWREVSMEQGENGWEIIQNKACDAPTSNPITPCGGIRPDIVTTDGRGNPNRVVEVKFPGDSLNPNQQPGGKYTAAANELGIDYEIVDIAVRCAFCWLYPPPPPPPPPAPVTEPVRVTAPEPEPAPPWELILGGLLTVAVGGAVIACIIAEPCGIAALGGGFLAGGLFGSTALAAAG